MNKTIAFNGYLGQRNIGDEAIFDATEILFDGCQLIDYQYCEDPHLVLYGGGTLLPPKPLRRDFPKSIPRAALGMGVEDPQFRNQRRGVRDLGYYLGNLGYDHILDNKYVQFATTPLRFAFDVKTDAYQIPDERFEHLHDFEHLAVRGPLSGAVLDRYGVDYDVIGDTALMLEPSDYHLESTDRLAITLRDGGKKWTDNNSYQDTIVDFLTDLPSEPELVLIPQSASDIPLHQRLAKKLPNAEFKDYCTQPNVQAVIDEYASCDVVIGEKLHGSVLSACSFTPFISLGYQRKNEDFAQSVGLGNFNIRITDVSKELLEDRYNTIVESSEVTKQLEDVVSDHRDELREYANQIRSDLL